MRRYRRVPDGGLPQKSQLNAVYGGIEAAARDRGVDLLPSGFPALLAGSASPYDFQEVNGRPGGLWTTLAEGRSGVAYEYNSLAGLGGKVAADVRLEPDGTYRFQWIKGGPAMVPPGIACGSSIAFPAANLTLSFKWKDCNGTQHTSTVAMTFDGVGVWTGTVFLPEGIPGSGTGYCFSGVNYAFHKFTVKCTIAHWVCTHQAKLTGFPAPGDLPADNPTMDAASSTSSPFFAHFIPGGSLPSDVDVALTM